MKSKKLISLLGIVGLTFSLFIGCAAEETNLTTENAVQEETTVSEEENQAAAEQLLLELEGSYQELWPVILADEYDQIWMDKTVELVGEENAETAVDMMASMVAGTVTGEDAVKAYANGGAAYCCEFLQDVEIFTFEGTTISGTDAEGNELFSHSYHYIGMEEIRGLYIYESDDADSGEFTYFCLAPDTMDTTWHIEFRYGSDLEALGKYDADAYAYWLASGIATDCTEEEIEDCIVLFCTENLSE